MPQAQEKPEFTAYWTMENPQNSDLKCLSLKAKHIFSVAVTTRSLLFILRQLVRILHKFVIHFESKPPLPLLSELVQPLQKTVRRHSENPQYGINLHFFRLEKKKKKKQHWAGCSLMLTFSTASLQGLLPMFCWQKKVSEGQGCPPSS